LQKKGHWGDIENRRRFLLAFAEERNFDPKVRANWKGMISPIIANGVNILVRIEETSS